MSTITVDFYGNLNEDPDFWQPFLEFIKFEGIDIYIVTGPWTADVLNLLDACGYAENVHYDGVLSILDYLYDKDINIWHEERSDTWFANDLAWWGSKAKICKNTNSKIHFDSDIRFSNYFEDVPTRFIHTGNSYYESQMKEWYKILKLANTYDENDYLQSMVT